MISRILLAGGGTGGHIYPLIAVAQALRRQTDHAGSLQIEFIGDGRLLQQAASDIGFPARSIMAPKLRRYFSVWNIIDIFKLPIVIMQSLFYVWRFMPDIIFAKGGYASVFPVLAGKLFFIPVYLHDSDAIPGVSNRWLSKLAKKVFLAFAGAAQYLHGGANEIVGLPVRSELAHGDHTQGLLNFRFSGQRPVILIIGGSQGADVINQIILESLVELTSMFQIIHISGEAGYAEIQKAVEQITKEGAQSYGRQIQDNYRLLPFLNTRELSLAYAVCDLVVSRAGASGIFETATVGRPIILIPLRGSASDHQHANALEAAKFGAIMIEEDNVTTNILIRELQLLYERRTELGAKLREFARPNAADIIAAELLSFS